jgi:hypothetical protein
MPTVSHSEREAMSAVRSAIARLKGPYAPIAATPLERIQFMRRHFAEIERDIRLDLSPAPSHLAAIAAHCVILYMEGSTDDRSA